MCLDFVRLSSRVLALTVLLTASVQAQPRQPLHATELPNPTYVGQHSVDGIGAHGGVVDLTPESIPEVFESHCEPERKEHRPGALFADVEFLFLRPRRTDADYALVDPINNVTPEGNTATVNSDARSGLRAGLGYRLPDSGWETRVWYTYFNSTGTATAAAPAGGTLYPTLTRPGLVNNATSARANSSVRIHQFDGEIGKSFEVDETLTLRLASGLRFLSLDQQLDGFYNGRDAVGAMVNTQSDFRGVGPEIFGEGEWALGWGLGLFSNARVSVLYGTSRTSIRETNLQGAVVNSNFNHNYAHTVPGLDFSLGLLWKNENLHFRVGYTINQWLDLGGIPRLSDDFSEGRFLSQQSNLSLEGVFFQGGFIY